MIELRTSSFSKSATTAANAEIFDFITKTNLVHWSRMTTAQLPKVDPNLGLTLRYPFTPCNEDTKLTTVWDTIYDFHMLKLQLFFQKLSDFTHDFHYFSFLENILRIRKLKYGCMYLRTLVSNYTSLAS